MSAPSHACAIHNFVSNWLHLSSVVYSWTAESGSGLKVRKKGPFPVLSVISFLGVSLKRLFSSSWCRVRLVNSLSTCTVSPKVIRVGTHFFPPLKKESSFWQKQRRCYIVTHATTKQLNKTRLLLIGRGLVVFEWPTYWTLYQRPWFYTPSPLDGAVVKAYLTTVPSHTLLI